MALEECARASIRNIPWASRQPQLAPTLLGDINSAPLRLQAYETPQPSSPAARIHRPIPSDWDAENPSSASSHHLPFPTWACVSFRVVPVSFPSLRGLLSLRRANALRF